jgi:hypothetical protein
MLYIDIAAFRETAISTVATAGTDDAGGDGEYRERADQSLAQANLKRDGPVAA